MAMTMKYNRRTGVALVSSRVPAVSDGMSEPQEDTKKMLHHSKTETVETLNDPCLSEKDEEPLVQIFVNRRGIMAPICLQLHPSTTIFILKEILQEQLGIQREKQHLSTLKGILLRDELSLEEQLIQQDANLELSIGPGLLGGGKKHGKGGKQKKAQPKNRSNERQSDSTPASTKGVLSRLIGIFCFVLNFIASFVRKLCRGEQPVQSAGVERREQPEPTVGDIKAHKSAVILGNVSDSTFHFYGDARPSGGNDQAKSTTDSEKCRARESEAADLCEGELKKRYTNKDSKVQMNPLLEKRHILDIYTDLVLESHDEEGRSQGKTQKLGSYDEVFTLKTREGNLINRTIFEGKAGLGKSTLISKIVYDWANGPSEALKKYKLLFSLKMHALEETSDFIKAIFNQLLAEDSKVNKTDLQSYIHANQENVLILLDGFDEFMTTTLVESKFGSVLKIVSSDLLRDCCVVVTTRPSQYHTLRTELIPDTMNRVKVLGFRKEDVEKYVKQVYSNELEKAKELLQKIQSSEILSELVKSPMLLLMLCALWLESSVLPATLFLLYKDALNYLFGRKGKKAITVKEISQIVNEIGKIALDGLLSKIQKLSFAEKLFEKGALDLALEAGILNSQKVSRGVELQNSTQFLHKTMQELCAGLYLQNLLKENFVEFQKVLGQIKGMSNLSNLDYLLRFCCGGNDECTNAVLAILKEKCPEDHSLALKCYFENQSKEPPTEDFINLVVTSKLRIDGYDGDSLVSFAYFLKRVITTKKNKGTVFLGKVEEAIFQSCNLEKFIHKNLLPLMCNMHNLSVLNCKSCQGLGGSGIHWAPYLGKMQKLGKLKLQYCHLNANDVQHIATIATLFSLDLSHNDKLGGKAESWAPCLEEMENLKKLKLRDCSLVGKDVESLAGMVKLTKLQLSGNVKLNLSTSEWSKCLRCLKRLEKLGINDCNIATEDLKFIAESCSDMPNLATCSVDNIVHPSLNYQIEIEDGTKLRIRGISLSNVNLEDILKTMSKRGDLKKLSLSEFEKLDSADTAWCAQLQRFNLKQLVLNNLGLEGKTIQCLVEQLKSMPDLTELYLNKNIKLKGSANTWFPFLQTMVHLQKVVLQDCDLTGEDWEHIKANSNCEVNNGIVKFK
ncbi:NLR family CARD domain-containing protein 4-like [Asterias rubens]|uniref:NLR family CARD domain-containing protein 4-like n=1 Tax=Asterias rubens TaxID=7604 RepID=UPI001455AA3A|nr:NLR family CARD domain-containing protein 4-like [Asterias rubens]XP_033647820.1 NLR family CARD domain-containing protein 4-like [Asterias rubens]